MGASSFPRGLSPSAVRLSSVTGLVWTRYRGHEFEKACSVSQLPIIPFLRSWGWNFAQGERRSFFYRKRRLSRNAHANSSSAARLQSWTTAEVAHQVCGELVRD